MSNASRMMVFLVIVLVFIGSVILVYQLFFNQSSKNVVTLTITTAGKFSVSEKKVNNGQKLRIKNDNKVNQTVKLEGSNKTVAEIDSKSLSKEVSFKNDSRSVLFLASDNKQKTTIVVGKPSEDSKTNTTPAPQAETKPVQGAVNSQTEPLPNTGPGDSYLLSLFAIVGLILYKISGFYWKKVTK